MSDEVGHFARIGSSPHCSCGESFPSETWLLRHQRDALRDALTAALSESSRLRERADVAEAEVEQWRRRFQTQWDAAEHWALLSIKYQGERDDLAEELGVTKAACVCRLSPAETDAALAESVRLREQLAAVLALCDSMAWDGDYLTVGEVRRALNGEKQ